jgi:FAD:protein FMN transferase
MKKAIFFLIAASLGMIYSCQKKSINYVFLSGYTQGTTYHVSYQSDDKIDYQKGIDSLLRDIDLSLSQYNKNSVISRVNINDSTVKLNEPFKEVFKRSMEVSQMTDGAFDITVGPLVNAWGFGFAKKADVNKAMVDSLKQLVGYKNVHILGDKVIKNNLNMKLDMNAIAQGYSVDKVADYLESKGIKHYMVEIGGELKAKGRNPRGEMWRVGIDKPIDSNVAPGTNLQVVLEFTKKAVSTSGNYRQFYIKDGVKYAHTIDPKSGYPVQHSLLSATIIADDCTSADAIATSCMVMGLEKSMEFIKKHPEWDAYFIYSDQKGKFEVKFTDGVKKMIAKKQ